MFGWLGGKVDRKTMDVMKTALEWTEQRLETDHGYRSEFSTILLDVLSDLFKVDKIEPLKAISQFPEILTDTQLDNMSNELMNFSNKASREFVVLSNVTGLVAGYLKSCALERRSSDLNVVYEAARLKTSYKLLFMFILDGSTKTNEAV